jgi:hypothetical protein
MKNYAREGIARRFLGFASDHNIEISPGYTLPENDETAPLDSESFRRLR